MTTSSVQRRSAEQFFKSGQALFNQGLYNDALGELNRAENAFRELDARGHPFSSPLSNGVSGLANSLALSALCCRKLGNYRSALAFYETSLINAKFEKKKPFRAFLKQINEEMNFCYEQICGAVSLEDRKSLLAREPEIDISFRFPYSLSPELVPFARLYELAPARHPDYADCYLRALRKDAEIRRQSKTTDDSTMKRMSISIWGILLMIWAVYAIIALQALMDKR